MFSEAIEELGTGVGFGHPAAPSMMPRIEPAR